MPDSVPLAADALLPTGVTLGVLLAALLITAAGVAAFTHLVRDDGRGYAGGILLAGARAALQLTVVALAIDWVLGTAAGTLAFLLVMYAVATRTAGRRITGNASWIWAALPMGAGVLPVVLALLATGLVPLRGISLIAVTGILIGGTLTATALAGRRALEELATRHGEVEAALAIGLRAREARLEIARRAASGAMIPGLDQTRTVGLVTLPGAFVGMLLGGASPPQAGAVQLFVLVALMATQSVAVALTLELAARDRLHRRPAPERGAPA